MPTEVCANATSNVLFQPPADYLWPESRSQDGDLDICESPQPTSLTSSLSAISFPH